MHSIGISRRMYGYRRDAHLFAGAVDAKGDLAPIGDEDFIEHYRWAFSRAETPIVMTGAGPVIQVSCAAQTRAGWMAGSGPAMTNREDGERDIS